VHSLPITESSNFLLVRDANYYASVSLQVDFYNQLGSYYYTSLALLIFITSLALIIHGKRSNPGLKVEFL